MVIISGFINHLLSKLPHEFGQLLRIVFADRAIQRQTVIQPFSNFSIIIPVAILTTSKWIPRPNM